MDEVERIFRSAAQLSNTVEECVDCIKILKEEKNKPESIKASELSDDDFAKLFRPDKRSDILLGLDIKDRLTMQHKEKETEK